MKIGSEKLRDEVAASVSVHCVPIDPARSNYSHVLQRRDEDVAERDDLERISKGFRQSSGRRRCSASQTHVLVTQVLEQLQLSIRPLAEHWRGERLHDLFDGDRGTGQLVLGGTGRNVSVCPFYNLSPKLLRSLDAGTMDSPDETECSHTDRLEVDISGSDLEHGSEDGKLDKVGHGGR